MPFMFGIFMSVMITSKSAPSSFLLAASPELTVSILWPSRRKAMSSISQIERSSSHTRILAMRSPSRAHRALRSRIQVACCQQLLIVARAGARSHPGSQAPQPQHEGCSLIQFGTRPDLALMGLHDLVHDGQAQTGAAVESGLEGFENLFRLLWSHAVPGVGEMNLPVFANRFERHGQGAAGLHRALRVLAEVPEHLLDLVPVRERRRFAVFQIAFNA